jgi:hypothetical protein
VARKPKARGRGRGVLELNEDGIVELLQSELVGKAVQREADDLKAAAERLSPAGALYSTKRFIGRDRVRVHVGTANPAAMLAEQRDRALSRARGLIQ